MSGVQCAGGLRGDRGLRVSQHKQRLCTPRPSAGWHASPQPRTTLCALYALHVPTAAHMRAPSATVSRYSDARDATSAWGGEQCPPRQAPFAAAPTARARTRHTRAYQPSPLRLAYALPERVGPCRIHSARFRAACLLCTTTQATPCSVKLAPQTAQLVTRTSGNVRRKSRT